MFQIGQVVSYGTTGICTIEDIRQESMSRSGTKKQEYYVLRPAATPTCTTFVPTGSAVLTAKIRPVMNKEQIDAMIDAVDREPLPWIEDPRRRAEAYQQVLSAGISSQLLKLIGCLYLEKQSRSKQGKKFCATDEKILSGAERMVSEEFSYALQISPKQVAPYIAQRMGNPS